MHDSNDARTCYACTLSDCVAADSEIADAAMDLEFRRGRLTMCSNLWQLGTDEQSWKSLQKLCHIFIKIMNP